jgi:hypothetical protein
MSEGGLRDLETGQDYGIVFKVGFALQLEGNRQFHEQMVPATGLCHCHY